MPEQEKYPVSLVTACMKSDGTPAFAFNCVGVTDEEVADGVHFDLVEVRLLQAGYEEPFVHFPELDAPAFLFPAIRQQLGILPTTDEPIPELSEEEI